MQYADVQEEKEAQEIIENAFDPIFIIAFETSSVPFNSSYP